MLLCLSFRGSVLKAVTVADASFCSGYIAVPASDYNPQTLTYPEANELIGVTLSLFVLAFVFRLLRKLLGF